MVGKGTRKWFMWEVVVGDCYSYELPLWWTPTPFQFLEKAPNCNKKSGIWLLIYGWHAHVGGWDFFVFLFCFCSYWNSIRLEIRLHKQEHTHKGIWTMLWVGWSSSPLALPFIACFQLGIHKQYEITLLPLRTNLVGLLRTYSFMSPNSCSHIDLGLVTIRIRISIYS